MEPWRWLEVEDNNFDRRGAISAGKRCQNVKNGQRDIAERDEGYAAG